MKEFLDRLLDYYNLTKEDYLALTAPVSEDNFAIGHKFDKIDEVVKFIYSFVKENKKIIVYGDYDADGIMATSIIIKMLKYIGYNADYYIPSRYLDGYGLNLEKAKEIVEKGYDLIITVDNGISAFEGIDYLKENGKSVVVMDHHEMQSVLPNCDYFLHPTLSNFGEVASSGAFVCFMFSIAFLGRFDKYLSTLASISLISDMMPLKEYNRNLLRLVISSYKEGEFNAIDMLKEGDEFNETAIGMKIAPKINSVGRLIEDNSINQLVDYFVTEDADKQLNYLSWINECNNSRKELSKASNETGFDVDESEPCIVYKTDEKEGLIGLIANFLCGKYKKPAIVLTLDSSGESYKGSCRAPEGFNVVKTFEALSDYLVTFGGHALAGGCSVEVSKFDEFSKKFKEYVISHPIEQVSKQCIPLYMRELTFENYEIVRSFSPFGEAMRSPLFILPRIKTNALLFSKDRKHILTQLGARTKLIGFNFSKDDVTQTEFIDLVGTMRVSEYKGMKNLEFFITDIERE